MKLKIIRNGIWSDTLKPKCSKCGGVGWLSSKSWDAKLPDKSIRCPKCKGTGKTDKK